MKTIHLHGVLKEKFGGPYTLDVKDPAEAVRALGSQLPGFLEVVREGSWQVVRGDLKEGSSLTEDELTFSLGKQAEVHIMPAIEGSGEGQGKMIFGAVMIAVSWWNPLSWATTTALLTGAIGSGIMTAGASMMMSPTPETGSYENESSKETPSYLFEGPVNTAKQGVGVPLLYGEVVTGSVVVSQGITAEDIAMDYDSEDEQNQSTILEGK